MSDNEKLTICYELRLQGYVPYNKKMIVQDLLTGRAVAVAELISYAFPAEYGFGIMARRQEGDPTSMDQFKVPDYAVDEARIRIGVRS